VETPESWHTVCLIFGKVLTIMGGTSHQDLLGYPSYQGFFFLPNVFGKT